jgi:rhodanese-related sulfurtransferase
MKLLTSLCLLSALLASPVRAEIIDIGNAELKALKSQGVQLIDLRTAGEWRQTGVLEGSQMMTLFDEKGRSDPAGWASQVNAVSAPAEPVVLICRSGGRSAKAASLLHEANPKRKIYNLKGGMSGWVRAGQGVVPFEQNLKTAGVRCSPDC